MTHGWASGKNTFPWALSLLDQGQDAERLFLGEELTPTGCGENQCHVLVTGVVSYCVLEDIITPAQRLLPPS